MSPSKKTTKKVISPKPIELEPKPVEEAPKQSHDWLPDEYEFSSGGVIACWAEPRLAPNKTGLSWIVIMAECEMENLPSNWQKLIEDLTKAGYYVDYKFGDKKKEIWKVNPPQGQPVPKLPFDVKMS